ncbi:MAG: TldD/PmbA family protein [Christensenellales bacterium]
MTVHETCALALAELQASGAQSCSAQALLHEKREFTVDSGRFSLLRTTFDKSLDLTLIKDHRRGKVSGNDFGRDAIHQAAQDCLASALSAAEDSAWQLFPGEVRDFRQGAPEGDLEALFHRAEELLATIGRDYPSVIVEQLIVAHDRMEGVYRNSLGAHYTSLQGEYGLSLMFSAHEGELTSSFNGSDLATVSLDAPFIGQGDLRLALQDITKQVHTLAPQGKYEGCVVFTPGCLGEVLGELIGNFASDGPLLEGTSPWKDKLLTGVADKRLTLSIAPRHEAIVCGECYTQDGRVSGDYDLIRDGVLRQFMLSSYVANKLGLTPAPNSSMSLVVAPGGERLEEIIRGIDRGLLVSRFSGGSPASNGDFSGVAKNSFLIERGKVGQAVSETMISGNLAEMVVHLKGLSSERVANGGSLLPWLAVSGITISGK